MAINNNGSIIAGESNHRTHKERMDHYDSMPPAIRKILSESHYDLSIESGMEHMFSNGMWLKETLKHIARKSAIATYGPNYPVEFIK